MIPPYQGRINQVLFLYIRLKAGTSGAGMAKWQEGNLP